MAAIAAGCYSVTRKLACIVAANVLSMVLIKVGEAIINVNRRRHVYRNSEIDSALLDSDIVWILPFWILEVADVLIVESWRFQL